MNEHMNNVHWLPSRSAVKAYAMRGLIGALLGAYYGFRADLGRLGRHSTTSLAHTTPLSHTMFSAAVGCLGGLLFWRLRWMRERGGLYYYYSWGLSVAGGVAFVLLPEAIRTREWLAYTVIVGVSVTAGFGLGAFFLLMMIKAEERED